jgi:hypothetical protein
MSMVDFSTTSLLLRIYDHISLLKTVEILFGLGALTQRDATAEDFLEVFSQITPRTDTPATLPSPLW